MVALGCAGLPTRCVSPVDGMRLRFLSAAPAQEAALEDAMEALCGPQNPPDQQRAA